MAFLPDLGPNSKDGACAQAQHWSTVATNNDGVIANQMIG